jgi:cytochrome bd ubiquinol oxidase subunit II
MSELGFVLLALMITVYVLLDGYDLGVGAVAPFVASGEGRAETMHVIGPYWNGNEVWLIASGGVLFALFPRAYASAFSGFYLPFMIVLWLLMFRGIAMEVRSDFVSPLWRAFWDTAFSWSSALLILLFGVAIGNLVRGLPLEQSGYFFGTFAYLLNPYALLVGVFAVAALSLHGLTFLAWRAEAFRETSKRVAGRLWWAVIALFLIVTAATFLVHPAVVEKLWLVIPVSLVSLGALVLVHRHMTFGHARSAFAASAIFLATLLAALAATIYPFLLPAYPGGTRGLSIYEASPGPPALLAGLTATIVGLIVIAVYGSAAVRRLGKTG